MINLNSAPSDCQSDSSAHSATESLTDLLDAASLETVLIMLDVIDSATDLALLETLTPNQKRQVWDATPADTRLRLKQLRSAEGGSSTGQPTGQPTGQSSGSLSPSVHRSYTTPLIEATDLLVAHQPERPGADLRAELEDDPRADLTNLSEAESYSDNQEETAAIDLESQREEIDLMLCEPLDLMAQPTVQIGDWVLLQAQPKLSKAEMLAIWEVIEVQGNYARITTRALGSRLYPMSGLAIYPKPIVLPEAASASVLRASFDPASLDSDEPEF